MKALFVLKILNPDRKKKYVRPDFFRQVGKRFGKKVEINFQNYDVINWKTDNYNTQITQHLKKQPQSGNEMTSVNRMDHEKYVF